MNYLFVCVLTNDEKVFIAMMYFACIVTILHGIRAIKKKEYGDVDSETGFLINETGKKAIKYGKIKIIAGSIFLFITTLLLLAFSLN